MVSVSVAHSITHFYILSQFVYFFFCKSLVLDGYSTIVSHVIKGLKWKESFIDRWEGFQKTPVYTRTHTHTHSSKASEVSLYFRLGSSLIVHKTKCTVCSFFTSHLHNIIQFDKKHEKVKNLILAN